MVGNITAGGSGKTPLVLWIVEYLIGLGWHPGIVSRGYGGSLAGSGKGPCGVRPDSDPALVGDEPVLLASRSDCPVWVGADRVAACHALRDAHPECDVLVLDDGLQHYRLQRDFEIAVVDARGFGNGHLFPAGPLRELRSRLDEVDAVVCNGPSEVKGHAMRMEGRTLASLGGSGRVMDAADLVPKRVHAVAGIGSPPRFFRHLESLGLEVVPHAFPDHHAFVASDLQFSDGLAVVMTEKDAVKCRRLASAAQPGFWMLPVRAVVDSALGATIVEKLRNAKPQGH